MEESPLTSATISFVLNCWIFCDSVITTLPSVFCFFKVLAVHPDYTIRQQIIETLRDRWLPLSPAGWHFVVAGLVRECQLELAMEHVAAMETKGIPIETWLHSLLVYNLCDVEEFDEVLDLMRSRDKQNHEITPDLWKYVLDAASLALHHNMTSYVWTHRVGLGYLQPSDRVCSNVLTVAARVGDSGLATSVFHFLAGTGHSMTLYDYERMADAHVVSGDIFSAFEILCGMHKGGVCVKESSTRSILTYMIRHQVRARDAWAMLKRLQAMKYAIPVLCAKVVIELCEHHSLHDARAVDDGIALYKELYTLCPEGADVSTYNTLINMCRHGKNHVAAMFVIKEMASLGVVPDSTTFEYIILTCLDFGNYASAYMYFRDMLERGCAVGEEGRAGIRRMTAGSTDVYAIKLTSHPHIAEHGMEFGPRPSEPVVTEVGDPVGEQQ